MSAGAGMGGGTHWTAKTKDGRTVRNTQSNQQFAGGNGKDGFVQNSAIDHWTTPFTQPGEVGSQAEQAAQGRTMLGSASTGQAKRRGIGGNMAPVQGPADMGNKTMLGA